MDDKIWLKRVLIPLWVIQLLISAIFAVISALALYAVEASNMNNRLGQVGQEVENAVNIGAAVYLAISVLTIVMVIVEIILAAIHRLRPVANIVMQSIKSAIWTVILILVVIAAVESNEGGLTIFLILVLFLACIGQLIYGSIVVHRHRKGTLYRGNYTRAEGGHGHYEETAAGGSYPAYNPAAPDRDYSMQQTTAYKPAGSAGDYYNNNGAQQSYEMHGSGPRY